jgi:hypothetical protein
VTVIQSAYEREASNGSKLHDRGLRVLEANCESGAAGRFLCQVTFLSNDDPSQRLYFDIVAVARTDKVGNSRAASVSAEDRRACVSSALPTATPHRGAGTTWIFAIMPPSS